MSPFHFLTTLLLPLALVACASKSSPDIVPAAPPKPAAASPTPSSSPSSISLPVLGDDARAIRETATQALESNDAEGARASVEKSLGQEGGTDKRTELIDKATEAARKKAKEMGKEEDLDKVRSALDNYLKEKDS